MPEIVIIVSPNMKDAYQKYGKCVYIDSTYNVIKTEPDFQEDKLKK